VANSCKNGNKPSGSIKGGESLLTVGWLLASPQWSCLGRPIGNMGIERKNFEQNIIQFTPFSTKASGSTDLYLIQTHKLNSRTYFYL
jgi:hypothetical protein